MLKILRKISDGFGLRFLLKVHRIPKDPGALDDDCRSQAMRQWVANESGQTTVEYLLTIGVVGVAMAAVLLGQELFNALSDLFDQLATLIALPMP